MNNMKNQIPDLAKILSQVTIFSGLSPEHLLSVIAECPVQKFTAGTIVIKENDPATEIYVILEGRVKIILGHCTPTPIEIIEFGHGMCFGEASVIGVLDHSATAIVMQDATVLVLSRIFLMHIFKQDPQLFSMLILNIARELARRLHLTDKLLQQTVASKS